MNIFRIIADLLHLASIVLLLLKIETQRSVAGISLKTQILYVIVFSSRYLDLFFSYIDLYNTLMKIFFLSSSYYVVYLIKTRFKASYDKNVDKFPAQYLVGGCFLLSLIFNEGIGFEWWEIIWAFSIVLEAVAILPQLFMLQATGEVENITSHYVFALGGYRALYILNWIVRYFTEGYVSWLAWTAGVIQTVLYADFFYYYFQSKLYGTGRLVLPS